MTYTWADDGFVLFRSGVPDAVNERIVAELAMLRETPGHELFDVVPAADNIFWYTNEISRALTQALGHEFEIDSCRHVHESGREDGHPHQDDYCGQPWPNSPRFAILCYYPQAVTLDNGATEVFSLRGGLVPAIGPAGTCLLMRHDLWHRATKNHTAQRRFMLKLLFRSRNG